MVFNMTIHNADNALISAIKSVCKLHPAVKVSIKKEKSLADELKAEQAEILKEYEKGTLKPIPLWRSMRLPMIYKIAITKRFDKGYEKLSPSERELARQVINRLAKDELLEPKY